MRFLEAKLEVRVPKVPLRILASGMDIFIGAFGSRGDVTPRVCLGRELKARGHGVTVGCVSEYREYVERYGLDWTELGRYPPKQEEEGVLRQVMRDPDPAQRGEMLLKQLFFPMLPEIRTRIEELAPRFDVITTNDLLIPAVLLPPCFESDRLLVTLTAQPVGGFALSVANLPWPKLIGSSPALLPPNAKLNSSFTVTDFWLPDAEDYQSAELEAFLKAGQKSVAVTFASAWGQDPYFSEAALVQAIREAQVSAVLQDLRSNRPRGLIDKANCSLFVVSEVPYSWLFARVDCVIHHGGAGTTAEALRAGRPMVTLPQYGDQQYWAERLAAVGASAGTLSPGEVTPAALSALITRAIEDRTIASSASSIGKTLNPRQGIAAACDRIEAFAAR
jgi:sterol 3beta-glucosyltransferase